MTKNDAILIAIGPLTFYQAVSAKFAVVFVVMIVAEGLVEVWVTVDDGMKG